MALYPCDDTGHRYQGPQQTIYPAVALHADTRRRKLRLCNTHFGKRMAQLLDHAVNVAEDELEPPQLRCFVCSAQIDDGSAIFFATVYATQQERVDYWAPLHETCAAPALEDWGMTP